MRAGVGARPSSSEVWVAGMSKRTQCVKPTVVGASGSQHETA